MKNGNNILIIDGDLMCNDLMYRGLQNTRGGKKQHPFKRDNR